MAKTMRNNILHELTAKINAISEAALFSHESPDGDCLGSMLALGLALETLGKKVQFYNTGYLPGNLNFLPGADRINAVMTPEEFSGTLIFLDCAEAERASSELTEDVLKDKTIINIDHHISNNGFGTINWVDEAAATGELVYELIKELGVPISADIAVNLYTAIVTDTGRFSYSNTTVKSFQITAELYQTGIDIVKINEILFEKKSPSYMRLLQSALANLKVFHNGSAALIVLSMNDFQQSGADESMSDGLVNYARNIEGVEVAALLKEVAADKVKVSFRSSSWLDVNAIAGSFGGGGHQRASGCTVNATLQETERLIESVLGEALTRGRDH
ncbi:bifunctional oligoribonuclease/PAP phosphatase NrnA [Dehalobacter sp. DCM]|uniref:DHH family phosphoesterase n=1 Tax=Dehalobacter sp. DCM TaxID=2907827 RepID=UPI003082050F|nr:bifunctional oligoribonuclease/PAP phosphatase NrnA [Dehalobacter sp. DCM]